MSHNGEINTLRGNVNAMVARQGMVATEVFGRQTGTSCRSLTRTAPTPAVLTLF